MRLSLSPLILSLSSRSLGAGTIARNQGGSARPLGALEDSHSPSLPERLFPLGREEGRVTEAGSGRTCGQQSHVDGGRNINSVRQLEEGPALCLSILILVIRMP